MGGAGGILGNRYPVVTGLLAVLMLAGFAFLQLPAGSGEGGYTAALERARSFFQQNPDLELGRRDRRLLGHDFVETTEKAQALAREAGGAAPVFSPRIRQRTQERFADLGQAVFDARLAEYPAWRHGVGQAETPIQNYLVHAFVHDGPFALFVSLVFLVVAGMTLEVTWGSAVFGSFCLLGILLPAACFTLFGGRTDIPFSGASGLVAALLAAYTVRGIGGHFPVPGWLLLGAWAFVEVLFVRGIWVESVGEMPMAAHLSALALGAGAAAGIRMFGVETKLVELEDSDAGSGRHPALGQAERARAMERPAEAFEILKAAFAEARKDRELALALWETARDLGRSAGVIEAILPILRDELRGGDLTAATQHWRELLASGGEFKLEATALIRLGEALLDQGQPEDALDALRRAVEHPGGLASAPAQRIVRIARDLDPALTQRAAALALADVGLDPNSRKALEGLAAEVVAVHPAPIARVAEPPRGPLSEECVPTATRTTNEATDDSLESDIDLALQGELTDAADFAELSLAPAADGEGRSPEEFDPGALSLASIEKEFSGDLGLADAAGAGDPADWNDPGLLRGLEQAPEGERTEFFEMPGAIPSLAGDLDPDPRALPVQSLTGEADTQPQGLEVLAPVSVPPPLPAAPPAAPRAPIDRDLTPALDITGTPRRLKLLDGMPLGLCEGGLDVEVDGRGKSLVPFDRIDALAVAAVSGLSAKPVLVIDLVLNWMSISGEPLKVIRLRSDRFDPKRLVPAAPSPLAAIKALVAELLRESGATPLPDAASAAGEPFASHADLASYQRNVLMAE